MPHATKLKHLSAGITPPGLHVGLHIPPIWVRVNVRLMVRVRVRVRVTGRVRVLPGRKRIWSGLGLGLPLNQQPLDF